MVDLIVGLVAERVERALLRILQAHGVVKPDAGNVPESGVDGGRGEPG